MSARDDLRLELHIMLRERKLAKSKVEEITESRAELMVHPLVQNYVELHMREQSARDRLSLVEQRVLALVDLLEEAP